MRPLWWCVFAVSWLAISVAPVAANLIAVSDPTFGAGALTRDTETWLDWLDLTLSTNRSYDDVSMQLSPGGDFPQFRHATAAEVETLFLHAGLPGEFPADPVPPGVLDFIALVGATSSQDGRPETYGVTGSSFGVTGSCAQNAICAVRGLNFLFINGTPFYEIERRLGLGKTFAHETYGHWLVRPVPEPGAAILLGIGLSGLALLGKRRATV